METAVIVFPRCHIDGSQREHPRVVALIYLLSLRLQIQLEKICTSYSASYGTELADDVNVMYHGDNKMAVVEKIDRSEWLDALNLFIDSL